MGRSHRSTPFRPGWIIRVSDRSMPIYMIQEELSTYRSQTMKQSMRLNTFRGSRESYRLSKALTQSLMPRKIVPQMDKDQIVVITISGRGDKDCAAIARYRGEDIYE